ncbi:hypothetical protein DRQ25_00795 [Candidatus Fermentibacteria bacterium]|nr:MAG: hypothetical protein DRQ25_00795 [Candidatus Fermentibacteria bacterium]
MEIIGRQIEFGVATEAVRSVAESSADKWMRKVTANIVERAEHALDDTTRGRLEDGEGRRVVQKFVEGDLEGVLHADVLGWFLSNVYGVVVSSNVVGSVYSHVFTLGQNIQHPSLTLFAKDGSVQQLTFANSMISTLEMSVAIDELVRFTVSFIGGVAADDTDTPSYDTEYDFIARDVEVKIADSEGGLAGATATKAKDLSITWDQGLIRDHVVGSYDPDDIYNAKLMIEGELTLNFADEALKDLYLSDDAKYMSITIQGAADIGSGNNPTITILLNKVQFMDWNREGAANELSTETVTFQAFYNPADTQQSQVTLQNLTSSYVNVPSS